MWHGGQLQSLQFIEPNGEKRFLPGGRAKGCSFDIGLRSDASVLCLCEGYATGASIYEATGYPVVVGFTAGNLETVARAMREAFPEAKIIFCADNDIRQDASPNVGVMAATAAAKSIDGWLAIPELDGKKCDFNDLYRRSGADAVIGAMADSKQLKNGDGLESQTVTKEWPKPLPLVAKVQPEPYPLDALPDMIRHAIEEVQGFTKAPIPMVASSALAALSLAAQAHADVKRADKLAGPVSLFFLTIADSGERKSTCDGFFSAPIRQYEREKTEHAQPEQKRQAAQLAAWAAERNGLLAAIREAAKKGKPLEVLRDKVAFLETLKPRLLRVPKLMRGDDTPENLAFALAREWPSAGVLTAEGGIVFGSHGMGADSVMRNMALLNTFWDGGTHAVGRRTTESFTVRGARLTLGLQVQEATLRTFFDRCRGLARGIGFLARFLVAWPESTQGHRPFSEPPDAWPCLAVFHGRITDLLQSSVSLDDDGGLSLPVLSLAPDAKEVWVAFHNEIETKLRIGGELYDVRDVASKIADNAARLSAVLHLFCSNCSSGSIPVDQMESACRLAAWHLNESRRFLGELSLVSELAHPARLDAWLVGYCLQQGTTSVPIRVVQQLGPGPLREKAALEAAASELRELGRAYIVKHGKAKSIEVNPALL
jgi:putative DNA primase/helicase